MTPTRTAAAFAQQLLGGAEPTPGSAPASGGQRAYHRTVTALRGVFDTHGLNYDSLTAILADASLADQVEYVFGISDTVPSRKAMHRLLDRVQSALDLQEPIANDLSSPGIVIARALRAVFATAVLVFSTWTVIGAILDGTNAMAAHTSPLVTLSVLGVALTVLALLEAAHIGAVALSTADVSELRSSYPRVYKLHRHIATPTLLEHYLAARQVGVVMIVFIIAEVTRTVGLSRLPGTSIVLPPGMEFVFQIGAPGALMVLIVGQVAPQLITARRPAQLMNSLPMTAAFNATRALGLLGLAMPASWLVAFSTATERIPSAKRKRYNDNTMDVHGMGIQTLIREVRIAPNSARSTTETTVLLYSDGRTLLEDRCATVPVPATQADASVTIRRNGELEHAVVALDGLSDPSGHAHTVFSVTATPRIGAFHADDIVSFRTQAQLSRAVGSDSLTVSDPTKLAIVRVILEDPPTPLPPAGMTLTRFDDGTTLDQRHVAPQRKADGSIEFMISVNYPDPGTVITLTWGKEKSG